MQSTHNIHTTESQVAAYFADIVNDMRKHNLFFSTTTFSDIAEYSDLKAMEKNFEDELDLKQA